MHLLALGAFLRLTNGLDQDVENSLNAPFGARCFLTEIFVTFLKEAFAES